MCTQIEPILHAEALPDYKLKLTFKTGEIKIVNFKEYALQGQIFKPLENPEFFKLVKAFGKSYIKWPQDVDFC